MRASLPNAALSGRPRPNQQDLAEAFDKLRFLEQPSQPLKDIGTILATKPGKVLQQLEFGIIAHNPILRANSMAKAANRRCWILRVFGVLKIDTPSRALLGKDRE